VESGRFFANAVDTETKGVDLVVAYDWKIGGGNLNINLAGNYTETKITDFHFPLIFRHRRMNFSDRIRSISSKAFSQNQSFFRIELRNRKI
jgi:outer membrane receptor protein involved in Fe transport